ncbi:hypothetical protein EV189_2601 [Motilibacter rhizosphaerae]|uniref:Uncharacterized protein n=1 Tax=Motilibacter rhizosphaerae TaxID=598652 RepID=A0A4V2F4D0_9ACTN|nr:hypothetical protein EV189_2601 [Motilibacter rhizosphaerae]
MRRTRTVWGRAAQGRMGILMDPSSTAARALMRFTVSARAGSPAARGGSR